MLNESHQPNLELPHGSEEPRLSTADQLLLQNPDLVEKTLEDLFHVEKLDVNDLTISFLGRGSIKKVHHIRVNEEYEFVLKVVDDEGRASFMRQYDDEEDGECRFVIRPATDEYMASRPISDHSMDFSGERFSISTEEYLTPVGKLTDYSVDEARQLMKDIVRAYLKTCGFTARKNTHGGAFPLDVGFHNVGFSHLHDEPTLRICDFDLARNAHSHQILSEFDGLICGSLSLHKALSKAMLRGFVDVLAKGGAFSFLMNCRKFTEPVLAGSHEYYQAIPDGEMTRFRVRPEKASSSYFDRSYSFKNSTLELLSTLENPDQLVHLLKAE